MSSHLTSKFGITNALNFEKFITGSYGNTYITFGRAIPWGNNDTVPTAIETANTFYDYWNNLIALKRITGADINLVVPRIDWEANTVYTEYNPDTQLYSKANTANIAYDNKFYVRNHHDQVFKCLFNNSSANCTIMPELTIGGQLPENAYIQNSDGYKWKYMYTIPAGLKEKFFTNQFMPISSEPIVTNTAVDGRLDIIKIINSGAGYNANSNSNSYNILTISGDGSNANITVKVTTTAANGANIVDYNVLNGGNNYTRASITITDPLKIQGTANANLIPIIGPPGGHGSNVAYELGATNLMISIGVEGNEGGVFPLTAGQTASFRQIGILKDPKYANGSYTTLSTIRATTKYALSQPTTNFLVGETVYIGTSLATATFTATVEAYDGANYRLYVNRVIGTFGTAPTLSGSTSGAIATILTTEESVVKRYSGDLLYIENSSIVTRSETETQQIKLTLRF